MPRTMSEVRSEGLAALRERLGRADLVRFMQQFESGHGDYARERHEWVDAMTLEEIEQLAADGRRTAQSAE